MPTRTGWLILVSSLASIVIGRVFGVLEMFVLGAGLAIAVGLALASVQLRRPRLSISRWIHPSVLTVGDNGRVDLVIVNEGRWRSPRLDLTEPVGPDRSARMSLMPMAPGQRVSAGYRIPAGRRGVLELGPLELERRDQLGLASAWTLGAGPADVMIAPRTFELAMPELGQGVLGRHLLTQAQRMGSGEFHSLRDYQVGDELRSIHWRASARSEELKVRQHTTEGVRRCIVILDCDRTTYPGSHAGPDALDDEFERAVVAAASLVQSGHRSGLTTRFVTGGSIDLRGPDVTALTLKTLAPLEPGPALGEIERDPGEGLGLVVVVTRSPASPIWRQTDQVLDPTLSRVGVFTSSEPTAGAAGRLSVDASSDDRFRAGWDALTGHGGLDVRSRIIEHRLGDPAGSLS
jgi:uncharacterized protein (DUF58 family)